MLLWQHVTLNYHRTAPRISVAGFLSWAPSKSVPRRRRSRYGGQKHSLTVSFSSYSIARACSRQHWLGPQFEGLLEHNSTVLYVQSALWLSFPYSCYMHAVDTFIISYRPHKSWSDNKLFSPENIYAHIIYSYVYGFQKVKDGSLGLT